MIFHAFPFETLCYQVLKREKDIYIYILYTVINGIYKGFNGDYDMRKLPFWSKCMLKVDGFVV